MISSVNESSLSNITKFSAPGLEPDVRLRVFDKWEFHVHSVILKLYSAFFRKFLDPSNKLEDSSLNTSSQFKYEWVTEIDDDGEGWHLISESSIVRHDYKLAQYQLTWRLRRETNLIWRTIPQLVPKQIIGNVLNSKSSYSINSFELCIYSHTQ